MKKKMAVIKISAIVDKVAKIGEGVVVWYGAQIAANAKIGKNTIIGNNVYIDKQVEIGKNCKIQSGAAIFRGVTIGDGVFVGPHVCFTNDKYPRATDKSGKLKKAKSWTITTTKVLAGASIGANSTILPGVMIGKYAMIGAGTTITKDVPDFALVIGNPAEVVGYVDTSGRKIKNIHAKKNTS